MRTDIILAAFFAYAGINVLALTYFTFVRRSYIGPRPRLQWRR
jgi:hypothetical protein